MRAPSPARRNIRLRFSQTREKCRFQSGSEFAEELSRQLQCPGGVGNHLHCLDPGNVVEEPAAACVHELRVALHLHELHGADAAQLRSSGVLLMIEEKSLLDLVAAIQDHIDIAVARCPHVGEQLRTLLVPSAV